MRLMRLMGGIDRSCALLIFRGKLETASIDIGRQNRNPHPLTFADENRNFFSITYFITEHRSHEFDRVIAF